MEHKDWSRRDRWLTSLEPDVRRMILRGLVVRHLADGDAVYRAADPPDGIYGVISGQARIASHASNGKLLLNLVVAPGDWFGEIAVLDNKPRFHDVFVRGRTRIAHLPQVETARLLQTEVAFVRALAVLACRHHRGAMNFALRALTRPVAARLAYALLSIVRHRESGGGSLTGPMALPLRQEDLANIVGMSRQTVAPLLRRLQEKGVVSLGYGSITVLDRNALVTEAFGYGDS
jgi:CRP-like cAMP-binding protein